MESILVTEYVTKTMSIGRMMYETVLMVSDFILYRVQRISIARKLKTTEDL